ncbi:unnamed protein product [Caenorhabditis brenneri]
MLTLKPIIVLIMLFAPCLSMPPVNLTKVDWEYPEEFLKEVNELRAKFAKEHRIPNMYKLFWSNELADVAGDISRIHIDGYRHFSIDSYRNVTEDIEKEVNILKEKIDDIKYVDASSIPDLKTRNIELLNPLQEFVGGASLYDNNDNSDIQFCSMGFAKTVNFWYSNHGEAASRCPSRFKAEDGLCVPVDLSKHTFWGTEDQLLEDVNYMRRKYAKEFGIPNMHQLTWNDSLVEVLKTLDLKKGVAGVMTDGYLSSSDSSWDGVGNNWRITELPSFSAAVAGIDETVHRKFVLNRETEKMIIRGKIEGTDADEMIHPLQTSIGCMRKERNLIACLLGNVGQWPSDWKIDANSKKIPGSDCMDGYVNDDGLCVLAPPTTTPGPTTRTPEAHTSPKDGATEAVPAIPKKPDASEEKEKEGASVEEDAELEPGQEALESSTRTYSYGPWLLVFTCFLF